MLFRSALVAQGWDRVGRQVTFQGEEITPLAGPVDEVMSLADSGYELIIAIGWPYSLGVPQAATENPDVMFVVVDERLDDLPNVASIVFGANDGSFLAGAAAALVSETGTVGFVGGVQLELIEEFRAGFVQTVTLAETYGASYSSGALRFRGCDSPEQ